MGAVQVVTGERVTFERQNVQPLAAVRVAPPRIPDRQEVVAEAEAGFEHDKPAAAAPAFGQTVAFEQDIFGRHERPAERVIHIAMLGEERQALRIEREPRRAHRRPGHRARSAARCASQASRLSRGTARLR